MGGFGPPSFEGGPAGSGAGTGGAFTPPSRDGGPTEGTESEDYGLGMNYNKQGGGYGGTYQFILKVSVTNVVEIGPAVRIGPRDIVTIYGLVSNGGTLNYSTNGVPDSARFGPFVTLPAAVGAVNAASAHSVRVRNLNEISISGAIGDGVCIEVQFDGGGR